MTETTALDYTYHVFWSAADHEYVATVAEFPSLSYLSDSPETAQDALSRTLSVILRDMRRNNEPIPVPAR